MTEKPTKKFQVFFRIVVLCVLLTGLLFSSGEGIRLFPFPAETVVKEISRFKMDEKTPRRFNAHHFERAQGIYKTKSHRNSQTHYWLESEANTSSFLAAHKVRRIGAFFVPAVNLKLPLFSDSGESRAPPYFC